MKRDKALDRIQNGDKSWDFLVIGGGATGLGVAVDAAARGYSTLLVEQSDFAKGTSSRSTKLVHGGVRYLKQGNISLVLEALRERGLLVENAPHLVHHLSFIVPIYSWWEGPFYGIGMKIYDRLAGKLGLSPSENLSREETLKRIPTLQPNGLQSGVSYYDGQFDDSRLAVNLAQTIFDLGGAAINYAQVTSLIKEDELVAGAVIKDSETGKEHSIRAKAVINATGVFSDGIRKMDDPEARTVIAASQGAHVVLPKSFLPGDTAIMVPHTPDGRVMFAVPWHDCVVVGTTDTAVDSIQLEPRPMEEEIDFILTNAAQYLTKQPSRSDVLSVFAGLRPLVKVGDAKSTAALSRDHTILISNSGLLTIAGGKWTTYRKMAQDAVDQAETMAGFEERRCTTEHLQIHGWTKQKIDAPSLRVYGADAAAIQELAEAEPALAEKLHPELPYIAAEVVWAVRHEMARTIEDVLARRTRALLLGARASIEAAPKVAELMARELGADEKWKSDSVAKFEAVAQGYVLN
ncbi:MAG: glycerol-3-phosphate dehydrogenase [Verrucomicrobiota bacterium]|jgi:glycerol-3-phosphate dehydrogenase|nr:glycerol-3-phosphate dehydrogenase [Verrucomicrobiota bacterium]